MISEYRKQCIEAKGLCLHDGPQAIHITHCQTLKMKTRIKLQVELLKLTLFNVIATCRNPNLTPQESKSQIVYTRYHRFKPHHLSWLWTPMQLIKCRCHVRNIREIKRKR